MYVCFKLSIIDNHDFILKYLNTQNKSNEDVEIAIKKENKTKDELL